ncbi:MAG: T9SS type A sorting domain-containing protein, partial [Salibacteraceae bacterium]
NNQMVGGTKLENNATGANSEAEVLATDCGDFNTSIKEQWLGDLNIYPNPATNEVFVSALDKPTIYHIYDMSGKEIQQGEIYIDGRISLQNVPKGMYVLLVGDKRNKIIVQ